MTKNMLKNKALQLQGLIPSSRIFNENWVYVDTPLHEVLHAKGFRNVDVTPRDISATWRGMFFHIDKGNQEILVRNDVFPDIDLPIFNHFDL